MKTLHRRTIINFTVVTLFLGFELIFTGVARADAITIVFKNGPPPPAVASIFPTTATAQVDYANGRLNASLPNSDDTVEIAAAIFNPACWIYQGVSLDLPPDAAIGFGLISGDVFNAEMLGLQFSSESAGVVSAADGKTTITIKVFRQLIKDGVKSPLIPVVPPQIFEVTEEELANFDHVRIDCVSNDKIVIEFSIRGLGNDFESTPIEALGVCNTEHRGYIQNLSGQKDPPVTARVNSLDLSTTHTPEPATLLLLGTGLMAALGARSHRKRKRR